MSRIRDEQKGIIFILVILMIIGIVSLVFAISLKVDVVDDTIKKDKKI